MLALPPSIARRRRRRQLSAAAAACRSRGPGDTLLRDTNRDRLMGLLTERCVG